MDWLADLALTLVAFAGHFALAVWLFNRLHAIPLPMRLIKVLDKLIILVAAAVCVLLAARWILTGSALLPSESGPWPMDQAIWLAYATVCWAAAVLALPLWLIPKLKERVPDALASNDTTLVNVQQRIGFEPIHGTKTCLLARVPGNQIFQLAVQRKTLRIARLPTALDGLTIVHLSDLHMTGHLGPEFYEVVVSETNELAPDVIVITGDILEKERCLPWGPAILSRLQARYGTYFILGNHERRLRDPAALRKALTDAGLIDLGSRCEVVNIRDTSVILAGTELPWFGAAPDDPDSDPSQLLISANRNLPFRLLLSHSPDQLPWAKRHGFDLMLAGHNHGGQIRLPWLGALISPSYYGWRYAGGLYHEPPTLMHVTRGISGDHCIRLNCLPELPLLMLRKL
jgi:predicted MPP superfamily phosphohydrolase